MLSYLFIIVSNKFMQSIKTVINVAMALAITRLRSLKRGVTADRSVGNDLESKKNCVFTI